MRIYSWNMLYRNRELSRALAFIKNSDAEILCLQEVPESFLEHLGNLSFATAMVKSAERLLPIEVTNYNVILSRYPIVTHGEISFPDYWNLLPWRTRLFVFLMPSRYFSKVTNRSSLYADVDTPQGRFRIFNLHLSLLHPLIRLQEFETALAEQVRGTPTIVCGDFNILESLHITPLNWLMGGSLFDTLLYTRERIRIENRFIEHRLQNPLRTKTTHRLSQSQLDHILVSPHFTIKEATVIPDRYGSDHHPIRVTAHIAKANL